MTDLPLAPPRSHTGPLFGPSLARANLDELERRPRAPDAVEGEAGRWPTRNVLRGVFTRRFAP